MDKKEKSKQRRIMKKKKRKKEKNTMFYLSTSWKYCISITDDFGTILKPCTLVCISKV